MHRSAILATGAPALRRARRATRIAAVAAVVLGLALPAQAVAGGGLSDTKKPAGHGSGKRIR